MNRNHWLEYVWVFIFSSIWAGSVPPLLNNRPDTSPSVSPTSRNRIRTKYARVGPSESKDRQNRARLAYFYYVSTIRLDVGPCSDWGHSRSLGVTFARWNSPKAKEQHQQQPHPTLLGANAFSWWSSLMLFINNLAVIASLISYLLESPVQFAAQSITESFVGTSLSLMVLRVKIICGRDQFCSTSCSGHYRVLRAKILRGHDQFSEDGIYSLRIRLNLSGYVLPSRASPASLSIVTVTSIADSEFDSDEDKHIWRIG